MGTAKIPADLKHLYQAVDLIRGKTVGIPGERICKLIERIASLEAEREEFLQERFEKEKK